MRNKIILSGLFLTTAISCSAYRPIVLNAFIDPEVRTTGVTYDDLNWSYALFNQYASGLVYKFRIDFTNGLSSVDRNLAIVYLSSSGNVAFTNWTTITSTYVEGELDAAWKERVNTVLFDRSFNRTSKQPETTAPSLLLSKGASDNTFIQLSIQSRISYKVNIGSVYSAFITSSNTNINSFEKYIAFFDNQDRLLQYVRLEINPVANTFTSVNYDLSTIITNVNRFDLNLGWTDIPPYQTGTDLFYRLFEFNLFTQNQEIAIPDDVSGDRFGFEFVAVEWWNFLGHLQNFIWWIVNKSPVAPVFEFIDEYVITWISGLVDLITGVFNL